MSAWEGWRPWANAAMIDKRTRSEWVNDLLNQMRNDTTLRSVQRRAGDSIVRIERDKERGTLEVLDLEIRRTGLVYEAFSESAGDIT